MTRKPAAPASTANMAGTDPAPADTTTMPATWAPTTYQQEPYSRQPCGVRWARTPGSDVQRPSRAAAAIVPVTDPSASSGSQRLAVAAPSAVIGPLAAASPVAASRTPAASALGRNGPGYRAWPSSACTTPASACDNPRPPNSSGTVRPARPNSLASRACSPGWYPGSAPIIARRAAEGSWPARTPRRLSRRAR